MVIIILFGATCTVVMTASATACWLFYLFFMSATCTPFRTASATACSATLMLFSANCAVIFCPSTTAAKGDTGG